MFRKVKYQLNIKIINKLDNDLLVPDINKKNTSLQKQTSVSKF